MKKIVVVCLLAVLSSPAAGMTWADDYVTQVAEWLYNIQQGKLYPFATPDLVALDASGSSKCLTSIEEDRKTGKAVISGDFHIARVGGTKNKYGGYDIPLAKAEELCRQAGAYHVATKDLRLLQDLDVNHQQALKSDFNRSVYDKLYKQIPQCLAAIDAIASNVPATLPFPLNANIKTAGDLNRSFCDNAKKELELYFDGLKEREKQDREPFLKVGIKGDKLDLMLEYDGKLFLTGGKAPDDLKKYAAASALFLWLTGDPDASDYVVHTVRKYQFKGNKLVKTTEKTYRKQRGAELAGSAFK